MITLLMIVNNALADITVANNTGQYYAIGVGEEVSRGNSIPDTYQITIQYSIPPHSSKGFSLDFTNQDIYLGKESFGQISRSSKKIVDNKTYTITKKGNKYIITTSPYKPVKPTTPANHTPSSSLKKQTLKVFSVFNASDTPFYILSKSAQKKGSSYSLDPNNSKAIKINPGAFIQLQTKQDSVTFFIQKPKGNTFQVALHPFGDTNLQNSIQYIISNKQKDHTSSPQYTLIQRPMPVLQ